MPTSEFRITIHMVSSLDGMIARKDNSVSWFETSDTYDKGTMEPNPDEFLNSIDCYVMGSRTYEHALELSKTYGWAYGDKPTIVVTRRNFYSERKNIAFYSGELKDLISTRLIPNYKSVWVVGGPAIANEFIRQRLAHEVRLSVLPIILGDGIPFFDQLGQERTLHLKDVTAYKNGIVDLSYEITP